MYIRLNARDQIVEATDSYGPDYTGVSGTVAQNLPLGVLGFNGRVQTPNYTYTGGIIAARTEEDMAKDPYSDPPAPDLRAELEEVINL